jgi:hypothetical protein
MQTLRDCVAGLDVHRDVVLACIRSSDGKRTRTMKRSFSTMTGSLVELAAWLVDNGVSTAVLESTGVYWRSVYYALEGKVLELGLVNAMHVKRVPGRKTDVSDAEWLADVAAHGMVRPSYVPPPAIRALRELTRYRKTQIDARATEIQRLEKILQDAGIKLSSVASGSWSQSAQAMVTALIAGERNPAALADMAKSRMRSEQVIAGLSAQIAERLVQFEPAIALMTQIPEQCRAATQDVGHEVDQQLVDLFAGEQLADDAHAVHHEDVPAVGTAQARRSSSSRTRPSRRRRARGNIAVARVSRLVARDRPPASIEALLIDATQECGRGRGERCRRSSMGGVTAGVARDDPHVVWTIRATRPDRPASC